MATATTGMWELFDHSEEFGDETGVLGALRLAAALPGLVPPQVVPYK